MKLTVQPGDGMRFLAEEVLRPRGSAHWKRRFGTHIKTLARPPQVDIHFMQE